MKIFSSVRVLGFRSISDSETLNLGPITLLVGRNNSGKSALLRAMYLVQTGSIFSPQDFRIGQSVAAVELGVEQWQKIRLGGGGPVPDEYIGGKLVCEYGRNVSTAEKRHASTEAAV
jgi:hypothetical protein